MDELSTGQAISRRRLGARLRELRHAAGVSAEQAAYQIRSSISKISRMESGAVPFKLRDVGDLLTLYGVAGAAETSHLLEMARDSALPGWWDGYADVLPGWARHCLGLEAAAEQIVVYEPRGVPALLQTAPYARSVLDQAPTRGASAAARLAEALLRRQEILVRASPPLLWVLIDQGALRRHPGDASVMRGQLDALIGAAERQRVTVQVIPFASATLISAAGPFTILRFADDDLPDVVCAELLTGAVMQQRKADVDRYWLAVNMLASAAATPAESLSILREAGGAT